MSIELSELVDAFEFVSAAQLGEHDAFICMKTGRIILVVDGMDIAEDVEFPEDADIPDYLAVPHRQDLDLGRTVALSFVAEALPASFDHVRDIFGRKGAYRRFKEFLRATGTVEKWHACEARATEAALEKWCDQVGVTLIGKERST